MIGFKVYKMTLKTNTMISKVRKGKSDLSSMINYIYVTKDISDIKALIDAYISYIKENGSKDSKKRAREIAISNLTYCAGYYPTKDCNKIRDKICKAVN